MKLLGMLRAFQGGAAQAEGSPPDLQGMLMHHLLDANEIEFQILGRGFVWHLPQWEPIHLGGFALDLSPTKHVVFMMLAAFLLLAIFIPLGRAATAMGGSRAPSGLANAMEALIHYFRDEVVRRNIGHGVSASCPQAVPPSPRTTPTRTEHTTAARSLIDLTFLSPR